MHFAKIASMAKKGLSALKSAKQAKNNSNKSLDGDLLQIFKTFKIISIGLMIVNMLVIIITIAYVVLGPILNIIGFVMNVKEKVVAFKESAWNFVTTLCWGSDEYCQHKAEEKFDKELNDVYDDMMSKYSINIDTGLIKATLLYNTIDYDTKFDEINTDLDTDESGGPIDPNVENAGDIKYNKLRKKIEPLAKEQISKTVDRYCVTSGVSIDSDQYQSIFHSTASGLGITESVPNWECGSGYEKKQGPVKYYIDLKRYEDYLRDDFLEKNVLTDKSDVPMSIRVDIAVKEIFSISKTANE